MGGKAAVPRGALCMQRFVLMSAFLLQSLGCALAAIVLATLMSHAALGQAVRGLEPFVVGTIDRGGSSAGSGYGSIWIAAGERLSRINSDQTIIDIRLDRGAGPCRNIVAGEGAVWVPDCGFGQIYRIDPQTNAVTGRIEVDLFSQDGTVSVGEGSIWVISAEDGERTLVRFDALTGEEQAKIPLPSSGFAVEVAYGSVWVTSIAHGALYRVDPPTNSVRAAIALDPSPSDLVASDGFVWALSEGTGALQQIDGRTGQLAAVIKTELPGVSGLALGDGFLWRTVKSSITQIDPHDGRVVRQLRAYGMGGCLLFGAGGMWLLGPQLYKVAWPAMPVPAAR
jgi:streptogramin lyase